MVGPKAPRQARLVAPPGERSAVVRIGLHNQFRDVYHWLLTMSWPRLMAIIVLLYLAGNGAFALLYLLVPGSIENARPGSFVDAFFFSVQTMATIGYGKLIPHTLFANCMVAFEALLGLLGLAMVTGLLFAKFSRPTARVLFSRVATIHVRDGVQALAFRMANERGNQIVEAQLRLVLARNEITVEGESVRRFHDLSLVRERTAIFALTWTAVHPILPTSPLFGVNAAALRELQGELIVSLMGIDETFSQTVHARHSYIAEDLVWDARFVDILSQLPDGRRAVDYRRFHEVTKI
jgi:inward rectifier potassium channel